MSRLHLFEWEDQSWFPALLRDCGTDFLRFGVTRIDQTENFEPLLQDLLERNGSARVTDLCSGGGGPIEKLAVGLVAAGHEIRVTLTDFYPNTDAFERIARESNGLIDFHREAVDARDVPGSLAGVRTMFNAFHHFRPEDAKAVLADALRKRRPIAVVEVLRREPVSLVGIVLNALIGILFVTPFIRPFRWSRLLFTYLIPVVPLFMLWDGLVSCLRGYTPAELDQLTSGLRADDWVW